MKMSDMLRSRELNEKWVGKVSGRLTVVGWPFTVRIYRGIKECRVVCKCECGRHAAINLNWLSRGKAKSCGCKASRCEFAVHQGASAKHRSEYDIWKGMKRRCADEDNKWYGGRGIKVCSRWLVFSAFLKDMGPRPSQKHSIDRINSSGDYEPGNCRWATSEEQSKNKRLVARNDISIPAAAKALHISTDKIYRRVRKGMSVTDAIISALQSQGTTAQP